MHRLILLSMEVLRRLYLVPVLKDATECHLHSSSPKEEEVNMGLY